MVKMKDLHGAAKTTSLLNPHQREFFNSLRGPALTQKTVGETSLSAIRETVAFQGEFMRWLSVSEVL
jgi:hypothetical protein